MASSTPLCGICDFQHVSKPAIVWCSECDEGFCTECSNHHRSAKLSRHHTTTPIDDYQKLPGYIQEIEQFCKAHDEKFILFCKHHDSPCCRTCSVEDHKQCQDIKRIEDVVQNVKTSNVFRETEQIITELADNIDKIKQDREDNLESLENSKTKILKQIQEFRVKVNDRLDKLQEDIIKQLRNAEGAEKKNIQKIVDDLQQQGKDINEMKANLSNIKQHASDLQAYLSMKKNQNDIEKTDAMVESLINSNKLQLKVLSLEINSGMKDFLSSIKTFGNIFVEEKGCNVVITKRTNQQAQLLVPLQPRDIHDIKLELQQTLNVQSSVIKGCCILPDGRLVFTDNELPGKLVFMNADGTQSTTLTTPLYYPIDLTYVKYNDSIAVSGYDYRFNWYIKFINLKNNKAEDSIDIKPSCFGMAVKNNTLYFCDSMRINTMNLTNKAITKFTDIKQAHPSYIEIFENNLYLTNENSNTIICYDLSGELKWEFKDEHIIRKPNGISVDNRGNVYVAGYQTSNVVVLSTDGKKCRELLSTKDKLSNPRAIYYERSTDNLIVANCTLAAFSYKMT